MDIKSFEKVKKMLCEEMCEIANHGEITAGTLATVDTLAHAIKNIDKIIMYDEYGGDDGANSFRSRGYYSNTYQEGNASYDGTPVTRGNYSSRGMYSRDSEGVVEKLQRMMEEASDTREREAIRKAIEMMR